MSESNVSDQPAPTWQLPVCECGHSVRAHYEEIDCWECSCPWFVERPKP